MKRSAILARLDALRRCQSGLAMIEFAYSLPILVAVMTSGAELTNYATVKMRLSQVALHIADNGGRIGEGTVLSVKTISETDINDILTGAVLQAGALNLQANGRIVLTSLEEQKDAFGNVVPNKYYIHWQRCVGNKSYTPQYGVAGQSSGTYMNGIGPAGQQITAPSGGAVIFVEVAYTYQPLISSKLVPTLNMTDIAAMPVRDQRDLTQVYNNENATPSSCT